MNMIKNLVALTTPILSCVARPFYTEFPSSVRVDCMTDLKGSILCSSRGDFSQKIQNNMSYLTAQNKKLVNR